ncbi:hypothetical protein KKF34_02015 [Myxococcota bacterium]|nr:hypothetical protein [Myxococcota bacterium]MBU1382285.1 hypothetical protein [Myxococcota bacterium]MBU1495636.1 hypothetical protein [Myxococcota bacterium]
MQFKIITIISVILGLSAVTFSWSQSRKISRMEKLLKERKENAGDDYSEKIARLMKRIAGLERHIVTLASIRANNNNKNAPASPAGDINTELKRLRTDVDAVLTDEALNTEEGQNRLQEILKKTREKAREERRERNKKLFDYMRRDALDRLAEDAGISKENTDKVDNFLKDEMSEARDLRRQFRDGKIEPADMFKKLNELRAKTDTQVKDILDGDAYKKYTEMRDQFRGPFGRRRR